MGERPTSTAINLAASGLNGENHLASRPGKQGLRSAQQDRLGPALRGPLCGEGRREGDLNPRGSFWPPTRFPVVLLQPGSDISPNPACVAPRRIVQKISEPRAGTSGAAFRSPLCGVWRRERDLNPRCHKGTVDFESTAFSRSAISPLLSTCSGVARSSFREIFPP